MAINVKVKDKEDLQKFEYPFIGRHAIDLLIVLFFDEKIGFVLEENKYYAVGHYRNDWCMESFKKFTGEITLSNKS